MDLTEEYAKIQKHINHLTDRHEEIDPKLYKRQLQIVSTLDKEVPNSDLDEINMCLLRLRYNAMMKYFSEKLQLPTEKYENTIEELSRIMGIPEGE